MGLIHKYRYILIASVGILIIAVILLSRSVKKDRDKELNNLDIDNENATINTTEAILIVENLLSAMDSYGTDETAIIQNLKDLNKDDLLLVIKQFGLKPYNGAGLATRSYEIKLFSVDLNLIGWLKRELSGNSLKQVEQIFTQNNIPF